MKRALISVSDKSGVAEFAAGLVALGFNIISTGGTSRLLTQSGVPTTEIESVTGFPEMLDGRLKTLHPLVHGGLLMRPGEAMDREAASANGIEPIDILCVNLYPFAATVEKEHTLEQAVENIDIGGPAMLRSAAKNHKYVTVVTSPSQYGRVLGQIRAHGACSEQLRRELAVSAFFHTAHYDGLISQYLHRAFGLGNMPLEMGLPMSKVSDLRYGENPHQIASFYRTAVPSGGLPGAEVLQGKELSYCNINDADTAWRLACEFAQPAAVAVKHATPCGVAVGDSPLQAYENAHDADPVSIFGGIVALNRPVDAALAEAMSKIFLDVIIAPEFTAEALQVFARKRSLRLLAMGAQPTKTVLPDWEVRNVLGGFLLQSPDQSPGEELWQVATTRKPSESEYQDLRFAWTVVKYVKSNAIVIARDGRTLGIGTGQTNRRDATLQALLGAGENAKGAVMASDAFFPMPDSIDFVSRAGVTAVIHPGGSLRDADSLSVAEKAGMAMVLTGTRHFRH
ncbi:MAG TPA: bifunctional phosphoribosylaminoimidazolecarboxamide formyltransferase/IMP cyclohydrolase [Bacillota bacterium]|nr:bifunctional phosphoribosylaminoimidazolecarboxamide formyltransferase/IMP cyclohydrolase [Bacillota bacterium]